MITYIIGSILIMTFMNGCAPSKQPHAESAKIITESGLGITDLEIGEGDEATQGKTVTIHYTGTLKDGTQFDSRPISFPLGAGEVIEGWDEGVAGMKVGGIRRLIIPPYLAYGISSDVPIPPNSTLIYEIELLKVN